MMPTVKPARFKTIYPVREGSRREPRECYRVLCGRECPGALGTLSHFSDGWRYQLPEPGQYTKPFRKDEHGVWNEARRQRRHQGHAYDAVAKRNRLATEAMVRGEAEHQPYAFPPVYDIETVFPARVRCPVCGELTSVDTVGFDSVD